MSSLMDTLLGLEVCLLPAVGVFLMITGKVAGGRLAVVAERLFFGTLLLATAATFRALLGGEPHWLMHAVTMAVLIVGSVSIPEGNRNDAVVAHFGAAKSDL